MKISINAILVHCILYNVGIGIYFVYCKYMNRNKETGAFFFLSGLSFMNIHDSQDSRGRGRVST